MFVLIIALIFVNFTAGQQSGVPKPACGVMSGSTSLVQGGSKSDRETFPWLVNIFTKYHGAELYAGSGSLISNQHILCAANSVAYENYLDDSLDLNPEQNYVAYDGVNVKVLFGSSHYKNEDESGAFSVDGVSKVVLHPRLAGSRPRVFNVAIIFLPNSITFSKNVSPVCLGHSSESLIGQTLYAAGYGVDNGGSISIMKKHLPMVVVDNSTCTKFYRETLHKGKAGKFFCARGNGIDTPCRYDKPLYIKQGNRWILQAMSSTFKVFPNKMCRPRAPVLYEDVTGALTDWVETEINSHQTIN